MKNPRPLLAALAALIFSCSAMAEDGYDLWLRYPQLDAPEDASARARISELIVPRGGTDLTKTAGRELSRALVRLGGGKPLLAREPAHDGAVVFGTPENSPLIAALKLPLADAGDEGFVIRTASINGNSVTVIASQGEQGVLYGVFHFLRLVQTRAPLDVLDVISRPRTRIRLLNHWDNLDQHVERGHAGQSIWNWHKLPGWLDPRYEDYARACASIGINGTVLTNVNANATSLTPAYIEKV